MATPVGKRRNGGQVFFQAVGVSALTTTIALLSFSYQEASQWAVVQKAQALASQAWRHATRPMDRVPVQAHRPEPVYGQSFRRAAEVRPGVRPLNDAKSPDGCSAKAENRLMAITSPSRKGAPKSAHAATRFRTQMRIRRERRIQKAARERAQEAAKRAEAHERPLMDLD
jgi:hypothetical protein